MVRTLLTRFFIAVSLFGLGAQPRAAQACDCKRLSWQEQVASSDAVFLGRVVEVRTLAYVVLEVREVFKGRLGRRLSIPTGTSDCDYFLPPVEVTRGGDFLIYATVRSGKATVSRCLGSGPVDSKLDELTRLRQAGQLKR